VARAAGRSCILRPAFPSHTRSEATDGRAGPGSREPAEDLFADAATGKALIRWVCRLETRRGPAAWRGLDILHFEDGLVKRKLTYAKAKVPLLGGEPRDNREA